MFMQKKIYKIFTTLINGFLSLRTEKERKTKIEDVLEELQAKVLEFFGQNTKRNLLSVERAMKDTETSTFSDIFLSLEKMQKSQIFYDCNIERDF